MHDLNTINRLNREAHGASIVKWRNSGKFVVTMKEGATLMSAIPYDTLAPAQAYADSIPQVGGTTVDVLHPTGVAYQPVGFTRDQSEDSAPNFATVGDYIKHVQKEEAIAA